MKVFTEILSTSILVGVRERSRIQQHTRVSVEERSDECRSLFSSPAPPSPFQTQHNTTQQKPQQALHGPASEKKDLPRFASDEEREQREAWANLGRLDETEAKHLYVELVLNSVTKQVQSTKSAQGGKTAKARATKARATKTTTVSASSRSGGAATGDPPVVENKGSS